MTVGGVRDKFYPNDEASEADTREGRPHLFPSNKQRARSARQNVFVFLFKKSVSRRQLACTLSKCAFPFHDVHITAVLAISWWNCVKKNNKWCQLSEIFLTIFLLIISKFEIKFTTRVLDEYRRASVLGLWVMTYKWS